MLSVHFKSYIFLIQCAIFYHQCNYVVTLVGTNVRPALQNEFPAVVSILKVMNSRTPKIEKFHKCTGTLVTRQDVLTAEHCIKMIFIEPLKVLVGSIDIRQGIPYYLAYMWVYDHWAYFNNRTIEHVEHDIAVLKLIGNVPDNIQLPVVLNMFEVQYIMDIVTAGWGQTSNGTIPRYLQTTPLHIISKSDCERRVFNAEGIYIPIAMNEICTVGDPMAILNLGDSGGPVFMQGSLIGINSGVCPPVHTFLRPYHVNVHVGITRFYVEFIRSVVDNNWIEFV